jgi:hypothetical protein
MNEQRDPFEEGLAARLADLGDTALTNRTADQAVADAAMSTRASMGWGPTLLASLALVAVAVATAVLGQRTPDAASVASGTPGNSASLVETQSPIPVGTPSPTQLGLVYTCGAHPFSPTLFDEPEIDLRSTPAGAALAEFIESGQGGEPILPPDGFRLAGADDSTASFVAPLLGDPPYAEAELRKDTSGWRVTSWGQCRPAIWVPGLAAATWILAADQDVDPTSMSFLADVTERACAGGRSSEDRVREPLIIYEPERVVVTFTVVPLEDPQDCPGNPPTRVRVELTESLGDRRLLDGGLFPWRDATSSDQ